MQYRSINLVQKYLSYWKKQKWTKIKNTDCKSEKRTFSSLEIFERKDEMAKFKMLHKMKNVTYITGC